MDKYEVNKNGKTLKYLMTENEIRQITNDPKLNIERHVKRRLLYFNNEACWSFRKIK